MNHGQAAFLILLLIVSVLPAVAIAAGQQSPGQLKSDSTTATLVGGYIENAWFDRNQVAIPAKLDSGANSSSINAPRYKVFKRARQYWVRFSISNRPGQRLALEAPIDRYVTIRRAGAKKVSRPIVKIDMCIGGQSAVSEFTLADRTGQSYQVLVGRKFLKGRLLVDSGAKYRLNDKCIFGQN